MDNLIIFAAKYLIAINLLVLIYLAFRLDSKKRLNLMCLFVLGGILSFLLAKIGSHLYSDPRPFITDNVKPLITSAHDNGFPSDHTLLSALIGFTAIVFSRKFGFILLGLALVVGVARILAHVHHAPDVVGGFVLSGVAVLIAYQVLKISRSLYSARSLRAKS